VAAFARAVVRRAAPRTRERAKALLFAAGRLAVFGESVGLEPCAEALFREATIERAKPPYGEAEIEGYLRLAAAQPTEARRMRATALVCLGAGAGLVGAELRHLRGHEVIRRSGGLMVCVSGRRARAAPVLARYHSPLEAAARFAGRGYLLGGREPGRRNLSDALGAALRADAGLPRLEPGRLRATWLCECAELIGLRAFMDAAGLRCSQRLGDLVAELPEVEEEATVALLGGGRAGRGEAAAP
jgi:integrase